MRAEKYAPAHLPAEVLDEFLAHGFFRMRHEIFITHFLQFQGSYYDAVWLRIVMRQFAFTPSQQKLLRRSSRFRCTIGPYIPTAALDQLLRQYAAVAQFTPADTLEELLGIAEPPVFNTQVIQYYDGSQLVAAGFFDLGKHSVAGIASIYHPDYKRYSMGRMLICAKMQYTLANGYHYFYPGYVVPGYPRFDYKLELSKTAAEYFDPFSGLWENTSMLPQYQLPLRMMRERLEALKAQLSVRGIASSCYYYRFFDSSLWLSSMVTTLYSPVFLSLKGGLPPVMPWLIFYDIEAAVYKAVQCSILYAFEEALQPLPDVYESAILFAEDEKWLGQDPDAAATAVSDLLAASV